MKPILQPATPHDTAKIEGQLAVLLQSAKATFATNQTRKTLDTLHAAQALATAYGLHRHAAQLKRALSILAHGSRPKLLTRADADWGDRDDK